MGVAPSPRGPEKASKTAVLARNVSPCHARIVASAAAIPADIMGKPMTLDRRSKRRKVRSQLRSGVQGQCEGAICLRAIHFRAKVAGML